VRLGRLSAADWDRIALGAVITGAIVRAVWVLALHPPLDFVYSDMNFYVARAAKFAEGGALERFDAFYPPGTHWLLAVPFYVFGTDRTGLWAGTVLWWALSALTPLAMWRFARYHLSVPAAAVTALLVALWPIHIAYSGYFLSETPALALLLGSLWMAEHAAASRSIVDHLRAGVLGGLAVANRPALFANLLVAVLSLPRRVLARAAAAMGVGAAAVLALVIVHNTLAAGKFTLVSENSGLTFWLGQCDVQLVFLGDRSVGPYFEIGPPPSIQRDVGKVVTLPDHLPWDQDYFIREGLACIRDRGIGQLRTFARGVLDMTLTAIPWPMSQERDLGPRIGFVNALYSVALPFILVGGVWLARERRRLGRRGGEAVMLAHLGCVLFTALIFTGDPRYRAPYDVFGLALAAALLVHLFVERRPPEVETGVRMAG
jgi:4-amino-4-deoxy-L-arabinose transferase-like glycosyltransferase